MVTAGAVLLGAKLFASVAVIVTVYVPAGVPVLPPPPPPPLLVPLPPQAGITSSPESTMQNRQKPSNFLPRTERGRKHAPIKAMAGTGIIA
jgi:hypothetical protein